MLVSRLHLAILTEQIKGQQAEALAALEQQYALARDATVADLSGKQAVHLEQLKHQQNVELAAMENRLREEVESEAVRQARNEENWKRVRPNILELRKCGLDALSTFSRIAAESHELPDAVLVQRVAEALKLKQDFQKIVQSMRGDIRNEDFDRLLKIDERLVVVFLDMARKKEERVARADAMKEHTAYLNLASRRIERLTSFFLKPTFEPKVTRKRS